MITLEYMASAWQESSFRDRMQVRDTSDSKDKTGYAGVPIGQQVKPWVLAEQALIFKNISFRAVLRLITTVPVWHLPRKSVRSRQR